MTDIGKNIAVNMKEWLQDKYQKVKGSLTMNDSDIVFGFVPDLLPQIDFTFHDQIRNGTLDAYLHKIKTQAYAGSSSTAKVPIKKKVVDLPLPEERAVSSDIYEFGKHVLFCVKIKGYSHFESPSNCQDAFAIRQNGDSIIVAVADGHGSKSHYLSEFGSQIAVETSLDILTEIMEQVGEENEVEDVCHVIQESFPSKLYREWNKRVQKHAETRTDIKLPATEEEIRTIYGTTAMFAISYRDYFLYGKLDGDIVAYKEQKYAALEADNNLYGTEAYSLCHEADATGKWLFGITRNPDFLTILTDGFRNACGTYGELEYLLKGIDVVRNHTNCYGASQAERVLPEFLCRLSDNGSADDITMCCIVSKDCIQDNKEQEGQRA
jgi:serine/threonine protein phosphatase PrpC